MTSRKKANLCVLFLIYLLAFAVGVIACRDIEDEIYKLLVFDIVATIVVFVFSVILKNSSVYDPYWSYTPMFMSFYIFMVNESYSFVQLLFLVVFNIWSIRLTLNWVKVFTDFSYEDWRYLKYREESGKWLWPIVNFAGIHMMPTILVFAGMLPLFEISKTSLGIKSVPGILIMLAGIGLEFFADRQMHSFLQLSVKKEVCKEGLWRYSRHPNYLGEISFWLGVYLVMLPYAMERWYFCVGCVGIFVLFNVVSIPLMEKRQLSRREDYSKYMDETPRLFVWPFKEV